MIPKFIRCVTCFHTKQSRHLRIRNSHKLLDNKIESYIRTVNVNVTLDDCFRHVWISRKPTVSSLKYSKLMRKKLTESSTLEQTERECLEKLTASAISNRKWMRRKPTVEDISRPTFTLEATFISTTCNFLSHSLPRYSRIKTVLDVCRITLNDFLAWGLPFLYRIVQPQRWITIPV